MAHPPEQLARQEIDRLLTAAGWAVQDLLAANIHAARGVAIRELPLAPEDEDVSVGAASAALPAPELIDYNPALPIETFDIIVTDECHRSIYNLWAQVLESFDASLKGLTATPSKQTFGFFHQNLVMVEYNHEMAVADGVNVNYDVNRIRTQVTEQGTKVKSNHFVHLCDKPPTEIFPRTPRGDQNPELRQRRHPRPHPLWRFLR